MKLCKGIIPALLHPFDENEEVDYRKLRIHVRRMLSAGVHGVFCLGTNGEFYALTEAEKYKIVETVIDEVNGKVPVYAGSGEIATRTVIKLTNGFQKMGVAAVSIITPYFINLSQHELYSHFAKIAENTELPIILYNIPIRTHINLETETVAALAEDFRNIIGIKDSSGDINLIKSYINQTPDNFSVLCGNDGLILDALLIGATGAVAGTANVIPNILLGLYNSFTEGNYDKARMWQRRITPLRADGNLFTSPGVIKVQANIAGYDVGKSRMPILCDDELILNTLKKNYIKHYTDEEKDAGGEPGK